MRVDNAVIMAAGTASRFAPLSFERPKGLTEVRGEILIEREIRQLQESGIPEIYVVTGYKAEQFDYLAAWPGVHLMHNPEYRFRNNPSSIWTAREVIRNTYICSSDNYFTENPFESEAEGAYYAAEYAEGPTVEWCMTEQDGVVDSVTIGGQNTWYMLGHALWDESFSRRFLAILERDYHRPGVTNQLWEGIYRDHLEELSLTIRKYPPGVIWEFDTLDELRAFDSSYIQDTRSAILKGIALDLGTGEGEIREIQRLQEKNAEATGFTFRVRNRRYAYRYADRKWGEIENESKN